MDRLPPELWLRIISFLSPSAVPYWTPIPMRQPNVEEQFTRAFSRANAVSRAPLKQLSMTSHACRALVVPDLFRCLRIYTDYVDEEKGYLESLFATVQKLDVRPIANTLTVYSFANHGGKREDNDHFSEEPGALDQFVVRLWNELFSNLEITNVTIFALPWNMSMLLQSRTDFGDSWSFRIPYQRVELRTAVDARKGNAASAYQQDADERSCALPCSTRLQRFYTALVICRSTATHGHNHQGRHHKAPASKAASLLTRRPWASLSYYGGSHLNNYGTYHYFEKLPPCILTWDLPLCENVYYPVDLNDDDNELASNILLHPPTSSRNAAVAVAAAPSLPLTLKAYQHLTEFTYSAMFPHYAHVTQIVPVLAQLCSLRRLTLQLAPDPASAVLDDLTLIGRGNLSLRDCWAELERGYARVLEVLVSRVSSLALPFLHTFVSEDYRGIPELRCELMRLVARWAPEWSLLAEATWTRTTTELQESSYFESVRPATSSSPAS